MDNQTKITIATVAIALIIIVYMYSQNAKLKKTLQKSEASCKEAQINQMELEKTILENSASVEAATNESLDEE